MDLTSKKHIDSALDILEYNQEQIVDKSIVNKLQAFCNDTKCIVKDFSKFIRLDERFPLEGKIKAFKDCYIKDFYYPAHENQIGRKVNWKAYQYFVNDPAYKQCLHLAQLNCNVNAKIINQAAEWNKIMKLQCPSLDIESLYKIPFHTACNFLKEPRDYSKIQTEAQNISRRIAGIKEGYTQTAISEIKKNAKQLELVKISDANKTAIQKIINTGTIPDMLDDSLIRAINELFKDFKIVAVKKADILKFLFKENQLLTREQFKEAILNFESSVLSGQKGDDIRIKFEE
jgi:hypothetical protein